MLYTDRELERKQDQFNITAKNGHEHRLPLAGGAPATHIVFTKKNCRIRVAMEIFANGFVAGGSTQPDRRENVTGIFDVAGVNGRELGADLRQKSIDMHSQLAFAKRGGKAAPEGTGDDATGVPSHSGTWREGDLEVYTRTSTFKGASTQLEIAHTGDMDRPSSVTLKYLWNGKFDKNMCEAPVCLDKAYRKAFDAYVFKERVERLHGDWVRGLRKRAKAEAVQRESA